VRPVIQPNKTARTIARHRAVMDIIAKVIEMNDKPVAEVMVDVEILEVDRKHAKQLGVDLANFAINMNFSPETVPVQGQSTQFNLNSLSSGFRAADFYMTVPTANIRLLESDQKTKVLAKTQLRGREGVALTLNLGQEVPIASTTYNGGRHQRQRHSDDHHLSDCRRQSQHDAACDA
jgi:general secretion pathway protein D